MKKHHMPRTIPLLSVLLVGFILISCSSESKAIVAEISTTAPTATSAPTTTNTPQPKESIPDPTATPTATMINPQLTATQVMQEESLPTNAPEENLAMTPLITPNLSGLIPDELIPYKIVFEQYNDQDSFSDIWYFEIDGKHSSIQNLTSSHGGQRPTWSPDCTTVAYTRIHPTVANERQIVLLELESSEEQILPIQLYVRSALEWSPDGNYLLFSAFELDPTQSVSESQIYTYHFEDGTIRQLTEGNSKFAPDISPETNTIAYSSRENLEYVDSAIFTMDSDGSQQSLLLPSYWGEWTMDNPGIDRLSRPAWSPDGRWLAFNATEGLDIGLDYARIYVVDANGGEPRRLTDQDPENPYTDRLYHESSVSWSADGNYVLYSRAYRIASEIWQSELCIVEFESGETLYCFSSEDPTEPLDSPDWCKTDS